MSLRFPPGASLLRVELVTAANFGAGSGTGAADRAVARDVWSGLPYLPWSSLQGVLAAVLGPAADEAAGPPTQRAEVFGTSDRDEAGGWRAGRPGALRLGDGELLCFPCLVSQGVPVTVFPLAAVDRWARLGFGRGSGEPAAYPEWAWDGSADVQAMARLHPQLVPRRTPLDPGVLPALAGRASAGQWVVAGERAAEALWLRSVERRTLTALEGDKRVRRGSLRTVELVPAGSIFLSLATNTSPGELALPIPERVQLGAWESTGAGFARLVAPVPLERTAGGGGPRPGDSAVPATASEARVMEDVYVRLRQIAGDPEAATVRAIARELGPRWRVQGLGRTLAFCAAKAGLDADPPRSIGARSYRFVLEVLLGAAGTGAALRQRVAEIAAGGAAPAELADRVSWLRRHAETVLPKPQGPAGGQEA